MNTDDFAPVDAILDTIYPGAVVTPEFFASLIEAVAQDYREEVATYPDVPDRPAEYAELDDNVFGGFADAFLGEYPEEVRQTKISLASALHTLTGLVGQKLDAEDWGQKLGIMAAPLLILLFRNVEDKYREATGPGHTRQ